MIPVKKVDAHAHAIAFPEFYPPFAGSGGMRFLSAEELLEFYDKLNVEHGVLLPIVACEGMPSPITGEACAYLASKYPSRFSWYCGAEPRMGSNRSTENISYFLQHYKSLGAVGVGELTTQLKADDPMLENFFVHCEACEMPVLFHIGVQHGGMYGIEDEMGLPRIERILKNHPKLILIGHSQAFWAEMSDNLKEEDRGGCPGGTVTGEGVLYRLMRTYPNLWCELSAGSGANAMRRDRANAAKFLTEFSDRVMYGCDICRADSKHPFALDAFLTELVESGALSEENYRKIVRENAIRLFKLPIEV